jgi:hypothetical protein
MIPAEFNEGRPLSIAGRVARVSPAEAGADAIAMTFGDLRAKTREAIDAIVNAHLDGPAILDDDAAFALRSVPTSIDEGTLNIGGLIGGDETGTGPLSDSEEADGESGRQKRTDTRCKIDRRVIALSDEAARVLIGRDLSVGGMRVGATPGLGVGDQLQIAIHVQKGAQPLVVSARVARDDGEEGMALHFVDLSEPARLYLEDMLRSLPTISEPSASDEDAGVIVSEVVARQTG